MFAQIRQLPRAVWVLYAGTVINRFGSFVMPLLAIYLTRQGYTPARAGIAIGAYGAGHLCASLLGGFLADRIGRRDTIALSMFSSAAAMLALSLAREFPVIVILTYFAGLSAELYRPASNALIADLVAPEHRVLAFSLYHYAINIGFAAGPATAGFLADHAFVYVFIGDSVTSVLYGVIALMALPSVTRIVHKERPEPSPIPNRLLTFLAATVCLTLVDFQMGSTFALHVQSLGFATSTYGLLVSLNGALIVTCELAITNFVRRFKPQPVIALGYLISGLGLSQTLFAHTVPALAFTVALWTLGEMISLPMAGAYVAELAPAEQRGRYMGFFSMSQSMGMLAAPILGTMAYEVNPSLVWLSCAALGIIACGFVLWRAEWPVTHLPLPTSTNADQ